MKKLFFQLAALCILLWPGLLHAQFTFTTNSDGTTLTLTGYTGTNGNVVIPSTTNGYSVTAISDYAFINLTMTNSSIPNSVTNIGEDPFGGCFGLANIEVDMANPAYASVNGVLFSKDMTVLIEFPGGVAGGYTIPASVSSIGDYAFAYCPSLSNVVIGDNVTSLGDMAFYDCSGLTNIVILNNVTNIGFSAFEECSNLTSVVLGSSLASIEDYAFNNCSDLANVVVGTNVTSIGVSAFMDCSNLTSFVIPNSVTSIGWRAFDGCSGLTNVVIGNSVTSIGGGAFEDCSDLTSFVIPNSVTSIGQQAFARCYGLTNVVIGNSVTSIGEFGFGISGLRSIAIPNSVTNIGDEAFFACVNLTSVTISNSASSIGNSTFNYCLALSNIALGNGITIIGDHAFYDCFDLKNITIPDSATSVGGYAFVGCGITNAVIGNSVTNIGDIAFAGCSNLANIVVNSGNLNYASFNGVLFDKNLTTLIQCPEGLTGSYTIPASVTNFENLFNFCYRLTNVWVNAANPNYASFNGVLFDKSLTTVLSCPGGFAGSYSIPNAVTGIAEGAFEECAGLTSVVIPNTVTNIGMYAFASDGLRMAYFQGNAPTVDASLGSADSSVFSGSGIASSRAYYLPGTTGWGATFGGWPTEPWYQPQPQILGSGDGLGVQSNKFQFTVSWATNTSVVVEASTNLQNWTPVITNTLVNGTNAFGDSTWTNYPQRFYRVRSH